MAVRGLRHGLPEGHSGVLHAGVKLTPHPGLHVAAFASGGGCHQRSQKRLSVRLKGFCGILAELTRRRSALSSDPRPDPIDQRAAGAAGLAEDLTFNNVIGHGV
jgi:hypothetical protein